MPSRKSAEYHSWSFLLFHEVAAADHAKSIPHTILTSLIWSITFFLWEKLRGHGTRSEAGEQEQAPQKASFLSGTLAHECNKETLENKVSLINAQDLQLILFLNGGSEKTDKSHPLAWILKELGTTFVHSEKTILSNRNGIKMSFEISESHELSKPLAFPLAKAEYL